MNNHAHMNDYDVLVVGGGLVGAATALALAQGGMKLALVEQAPPSPLPNDASWDSRIYAITPGNAGFLRRLGVWDALDASRIAPIHTMRIWGDDGEAQLEFDSYAAGVPELGFIVESRLMQDGLWRALQDEPNVELVCPASCAALEMTASVARLRLQDSCVLSARLLVGADGSSSWVRRQAGIDVDILPYRQLGVVANLETEKSHGDIARQWFLQDGILAWLPLPGKRISIVWSAYEQQAQALLQLDAKTFCDKVAQAGHYALGSLRQFTAPQAFPLNLRCNKAMIAPRLALVGDAAHGVHPLSGQGANLGFRDAAALSQVLLAARPNEDIGGELLLRRYERARKADVYSTQAVTTGLQKLFNNNDPLLARLRNFGLGMVDHISPLKRQLMARAIL